MCRFKKIVSTAITLLIVCLFEVPLMARIPTLSNPNTPKFRYDVNLGRCVPIHGQETQGPPLSKNSLGQCSDLRNQDLRGVRFGGKDLSGSVFDGSNLEGVDFSSPSPSARLAGQRRLSSRVSSTLLRGASFQKTNMARTNLRRVNAQEAIIRGALFDNAILDNADFRHATIEDSTFKNASVVGTDFRGVQWSHVELETPSVSRALVDAHELVVDVSEGGAVEILGMGIDESCDSEERCTYKVNAPNDVSLRAADLSAPNFLGWSAGCEDSDPECVIEMTSNQVVRGVFSSNGQRVVEWLEYFAPSGRRPGEPVENVGAERLWSMVSNIPFEDWSATQSPYGPDLYGTGIDSSLWLSKQFGRSIHYYDYSSHLPSVDCNGMNGTAVLPPFEQGFSLEVEIEPYLADSDLVGSGDIRYVPFSLRVQSGTRQYILGLFKGTGAGEFHIGIIHGNRNPFSPDNYAMGSRAFNFASGHLYTVRLAADMMGDAEAEIWEQDWAGEKRLVSETPDSGRLLWDLLPSIFDYPLVTSVRDDGSPLGPEEDACGRPFFAFGLNGDDGSGNYWIRRVSWIVTE